MRPRPIVPPGKAGLLVIAVATVPLILSRCKPFAKRVGSKLVEWGEKLQKEEEKSSEPQAAKDSAKSKVPKAGEDASGTATSAPAKDVAKSVVPRTDTKKSTPKAKPSSPKKPVPRTKAGAGTKPKKAATKPKA